MTGWRERWAKGVSYCSSVLEMVIDWRGMRQAACWIFQHTLSGELMSWMPQAYPISHSNLMAWSIKFVRIKLGSTMLKKITLTDWHTMQQVFDHPYTCQLVKPPYLFQHCFISRLPSTLCCGWSLPWHILLPLSLFTTHLSTCCPWHTWCTWCFSWPISCSQTFSSKQSYAWGYSSYLWW